MFIVLFESEVFHCPLGSKLSGEDSAFCCLCVCCELIGYGDAGTIGSNVGVGLGTKAEVEGKGLYVMGTYPAV